MSEVLTAGQLVKLGKEHLFSLALRQQWHMKTGVDPYNYLVLVVRHVYLMWVTGCLGVVTTPLVAIAVLHWSGTMTWGGSPVFQALIGIAVFVFIVSLVVTMYYEINTSHARRVAGDFLDQFSCLLRYLGNAETNLEDVAKAIAIMDVSTLQPRAKECTITAALAVVEFLENKPRSADSGWYEAVAKLDDQLTEVYCIMAVFGLVHGGRDHFTKEAKKLLARKKKDQMSAAG